MHAALRTPAQNPLISRHKYINLCCGRCSDQAGIGVILGFGDVRHPDGRSP